jgi:hypothetical protein
LLQPKQQKAAAQEKGRDDPELKQNAQSHRRYSTTAQLDEGNIAEDQGRVNQIAG